MARQTLVVDASVGVKWFIDAGETPAPQALALMKAHAHGDVSLLVPDLFFHEIASVMVDKKNISMTTIEESLRALFDLGLSVFNANEQRLRQATQLARKADITVYDAYYVVAAIENSCPLITANPRHQKLGRDWQIIPIEQWKLEAL